MSSAGYIYLLKTFSSIQKNENVFKIGKTHRKQFKRFFEYPEGSVLLHQTSCYDCDKMEKILLTSFNEKFIKRNDYGREYFEGDYKRMIKIINFNIKNEIIDDSNIFFWEELNKDKNEPISINKTNFVDYSKKPQCIENKNILPVTIKENYGVVNISHMSDITSFTTSNPEIIHFINTNKLINFEYLMLQTIKKYSNQTAGNVELSMDEIAQIYKEHQSVLNFKRNFENLSKEIRTNFYKIKEDTIENLCAKHLKIKQESFTCEHCNTFSCSTKKGITTHSRKCSKNSVKNEIISEDDEEES